MRTPEFIVKELIAKWIHDEHLIFLQDAPLLSCMITQAIQAERARAQGLVDALEGLLSIEGLNWMNHRTTEVEIKRARQALAGFRGEKV